MSCHFTPIPYSLLLACFGLCIHSLSSSWKQRRSRALQKIGPFSFRRNRHTPFHVTRVYEMGSISKKNEDGSFRSPASVEAVQIALPRSAVDDLDNDISPESVSAASRKESHRASERVGAADVF